MPNQLLLPGYVMPGSAQAAALTRRRGAVEFFVKDNHPRIMADIASGDGPYLNETIALAKVPAASRAALKLDLHGDWQVYQRSPAALITVLMGYSS